MRRRLLHSGTRLRFHHRRMAAKPLILLWLFFFPSSLPAQLPEPPEAKAPLFVEADSLEYRRGERLLIGKGEVFARFQNQTLSADLVEVDLDEEVLRAAGRVVLTEGLNRLGGERLEYRYREKTGVMHRARGFIAPAASFEGRELYREGEKRYRLLDAVVTTCRICEPQLGRWEFRSKEVIIEQDEAISAKSVSFWVHEIPIAYSPYVAFPIGPRRTGFLSPQVGYSNRAGVLYKQPFFWAISESQDATFTLGFRSRRGIEADVEYRYILSEAAWGEWKGRYLRDREAGSPFRQDRLGLQGKHDQLFSPGLSLKADVDYVSDRILRREFFEEPVEFRTARVSNSRVFLTQASPSFTFQALLSLSQDQAGVEQSRFVQMPELTFKAPPQPLGDTPLLIALDSSAAFFEQKRGIDAGRLDLFPQLSLPLPFRPWLTLTPSIGLRGTAYTTEEDSRDGVTGRGLFELGSTLQTQFFRSFEMKNGYLLHFVTPRLSYRFVPEVDQKRFPQLDGSDFISPQNRITYGFDSRLIARLKEADGTIRSREVLTFSLDQSVNLDPEEREFSNLFLTALTPERIDQAVKDVTPLDQGFSKAKERRFSNLVANLVLTPSPFLAFRGTFGFNPEESRGDVTNARLQFTYPGVGFVELGESHILREALLLEPRQAVNAWIGRLNLGPFRGLSLDLSSRLDAERGVFLETQAVLQYATCCWGVSFRYANRSGIPGIRDSDNDFRVTLELRGRP